MLVSKMELKKLTNISLLLLPNNIYNEILDENSSIQTSNLRSNE